MLELVPRVAIWHSIRSRFEILGSAPRRNEIIPLDANYKQASFAQSQRDWYPCETPMHGPAVSAFIPWNENMADSRWQRGLL